MLTIKEINQKARQFMFDDEKIPHANSNPVLREEDGKICIAYFGYTYDRQNLAEKKFKRPTRWLLLDIETGEVIKRMNCGERDFSAEPFDKLYSLNDPGVVKPTEDYFSIMDTLFDTARASVIFAKRLDKANYQAYLKDLYAITPKEYRGFYKELSL